ncbi:MAG: hypothetical protein ABH828_06345 [archaeon]
MPLEFIRNMVLNSAPIVKKKEMEYFVGHVVDPGNINFYALFHYDNKSDITTIVTRANKIDVLAFKVSYSEVDILDKYGQLQISMKTIKGPDDRLVGPLERTCLEEDGNEIKHNIYSLPHKRKFRKLLINNAERQINHVYK